LLSQWVTVTVVYDLEETVSVATVPVDVVTWHPVSSQEVIVAVVDEHGTVVVMV
jgi:hypothetical protein